MAAGAPYHSTALPVTAGAPYHSTALPMAAGTPSLLAALPKRSLMLIKSFMYPLVWMCLLKIFMGTYSFLQGNIM